MFVRICRYRVLPTMVNRFLAVQERAHDIYRKHVPERTAYYQSTSDPQQWVEIHHYASEEACHRSSLRISQEPEIVALWQEFQATLDPSFPTIIEEFQQRVWMGDKGAGENERTGT